MQIKAKESWRSKTNIRKIDFKIKIVSTDKEVYSIMVKGSKDRVTVFPKKIYKWPTGT